MRSSRALAASLIPNLLAGLTSGLVTLVYSISFAALIFSGSLTTYFPQGVGIALIGATVTAIIVAWRSQFPFVVAGPEANSAILIALAAASIASASSMPEQDPSTLPTVWATIVLGTVATGLFLYLLGHFRWGRLARYIPYPVIGGFLAGTGWLITRSSFKVMTGVPLGVSGIPVLLQGEVAAQWISGALVATALVIVLGRFKHFLVLPGMLAGGVALGNLSWPIVRRFAPEWKVDAWFFEPFSNDSVWRSWRSATLDHVDWTLLFQQGGTLLAMMVIVMLSILLNSTGLELATSRNVDLDQELKANGVANIVNGVCGGMVGYLSINRCLLNQQAGARSPLAGIIAGGLCGCVLLLGSSFLAYVPKPLLGGLLLFIGGNLLVRWVVNSRSQFSGTDYLLIVSILVIIGTFGFLQGVGAGILISCLLFIVSYGRTSSIKHSLSGGSYQSNVSRPDSHQRYLEVEGDAIAIVVLHGFVFFGTAHDLLDGIRGRLAAAGRRRLEFVVFDFRLVTGLDSSAVLSFKKLRQLAENSLMNLVFTHLSVEVETQLKEGGLFSGDIERLRRFTDLDRGVEWCENRILEGGGMHSCPAAPLLSQLQDFLNDTDFASRMLPYFEAMDLSEGQAVFRQGERSDGLYFLESGRASVVVELPNGRTLRRRSFTGGAILGEMGFYTGDPRSASVIADQPCRLHYLSIQAFQKLESDYPPLASCFHRAVVGLVANRLRRSEDEVKELLQ